MSEIKTFRDPLARDTIASARISDKEIALAIGRSARECAVCKRLWES